MTRKALNAASEVEIDMAISSGQAVANVHYVLKVSQKLKVHKELEVCNRDVVLLTSLGKYGAACSETALLEFDSTLRLASLQCHWFCRVDGCSMGVKRVSIK